MLNDFIKDYINEPNNPTYNYTLGREYERLGQTAAAISYFL